MIHRNTVDLTDEIHHDEPAAYLVFGGPTLREREEYRVFGDWRSADDFARDQEDDARDHGETRDWQVFPLYASHPVGLDDRTWD